MHTSIALYQNYKILWEKKHYKPICVINTDSKNFYKILVNQTQKFIKIDTKQSFSKNVTLTFRIWSL